MTINFEEYNTRIESTCVQEAGIIGDKNGVDLDWQSVENVMQPHKMSISKNNKEIMHIELAEEHKNADMLPELCKELITRYELNQLDTYAANYEGRIHLV